MAQEIHKFTTIEQWDKAYDSYYSIVRQINQELYEISKTKGKVFETWLLDYKQQSVHMQELYQKGTDFMQEYLQQYIGHPENWEPEVADSLLSYLFLKCMRLEDTRMIYAATASLLEYYTSRQDEIAEMKCHYILGICLHVLDIFHFGEEILAHCRRAIELYEAHYQDLSDMEKSYGLSFYDLNAVCRYETIRINEQFPAYFLTVLLPELEHTIFMIEKFMDETDMNREYNAVIPMIRSSLLSSFFGVMLQLKHGQISDEMARHIYELTREYYGHYEQKGELEQIHENISYIMSIRVYKQLDQALVFQTILTDVKKLPDHLNGRDFNYDNYLIEAWMTALASMRTLIQEACMENETVFEEQFDRFVALLISVPFGRKLEHMADTAIFNFVCSQLIYIKDEKKVLAYVLKLMVFRQVQTGIHSLMVCEAADLITKEIVHSKPQLLVNQLGCTCVHEVLHKAKEFSNYIRIGALVHDIGKVCCSEVINMQYRRLSDMEYKTLQFHPQSSGEILTRIPQLACYYDLAVGHHKSYDGSFGYPQSFDNVSSPQKIFIDIISICDSLDAATDTYGRNYAKAKKFDDVLHELKAEAGTRYSDVITAFIDQNKELKHALRTLLEEQREDACRNTFRILNADVKGLL